MSAVETSEGDSKEVRFAQGVKHGLKRFHLWPCSSQARDDEAESAQDLAEEEKVRQPERRLT